MGIVSTNALKLALQLNNEKIKEWVGNNAGKASIELCEESLPEELNEQTIYVVVDKNQEVVAIAFFYDGNVYKFNSQEIPEDIVRREEVESMFDSIPNATKNNRGYMSSSDKMKLDDLRNYVPPRHTPYKLGLYKIAVDAEGKVVNAVEWIPTVSQQQIRHLSQEISGEKMWFEMLETTDIRVVGLRFSDNISDFYVEVAGEVFDSSKQTYDIPHNTDWRIGIYVKDGEHNLVTCDINYIEL